MRLFKKKKKIEDGVSTEIARLVDLLHHHTIDTVLDIGGNVGQYSAHIRRAGFNGRIVSFEPLSQAHEALLQLSKDDPMWEIAPRMAIGDKDGEATINVSANDDMSSILDLEPETLTALRKSKVVGQETVPLKKLDDLYDTYTSNGDKVFVKIDTQGYEMPILEGAVNTINAGKIHGFQLEVSLLPLYTGEPTFEHIAQWIKAKGYEPHYTMPGYFSKKLLRQLQFDLVYFKA